MRRLSARDAKPGAGDVVLARVDRLGHHKRLERCDGRRATLFPGDEIVVCYGNRYAPDQFEAEVSNDLGPCQLVAGGGIAATAITWHNRIVLGPTEITPLGLVCDGAGRPLSVGSYALDMTSSPGRVPSVAVLGTAMNSGKTTTAAALVRGLVGAGHRVGAVKLTGTGSGGDLWRLWDAGAHAAYDFTDAGYASTYLTMPHELECIAQMLVGQLSAEGCTVIVAELADGLFQRETAGLVQTAAFRELFSSVVFAAREAMGASAGVAWLQRAGFHVPAISGRVSASPLAAREAEAATGLRCVEPDQLQRPDGVLGLLPDLEKKAA